MDDDRDVLIAELRESTNAAVSTVEAAVARAEEQGRELAELRAWKEEALAVEREWDEQALARMLGVELGRSCRAGIAEKVPALLAELAELKAACAVCLPVVEHAYTCTYLVGDCDCPRRHLAALLEKRS